MPAIVEIFKTNVCCNERACELLLMLRRLFPHYDMNFDLEDQDRILRIASGELIDPEVIIGLLLEKQITASHIP